MASSATCSSFRSYRRASRRHNAATLFAIGKLDLGRRKPPNNLAAYDCVLRGISIHESGHATAEEAKEAVAWFDRALELDPNYARAPAAIRN